MNAWLLADAAAIAVQVFGLVLMAVGAWRAWHRDGDRDDLVGRGGTLVLVGGFVALVCLALGHPF